MSAVNLRAIEWGSAGEWVAAAATFLAVLVALFGERAWEYWRRPRLAARVSNIEPHRSYARAADGEASDGLSLYRLEIRNEGRGVARDLHARLIDVWDLGHEGWRQHGVDPVPQPFVSQSLAGAPARGVDIGPGGSELVEFLQAGAGRLSLLNIPARMSFADSLYYAPRYVVGIQLSGANLAPTDFYVELYRKDGGEVVMHGLIERPTTARLVGLHALLSTYDGAPSDSER